MNKLWYQSRSLWVGFISIIGIVFFGADVVPPEIQAVILSVIVFILRFITKKPIVLTKNQL